MTRAPEIPDEPRSFEADTTPRAPKGGEQNGHAPQPSSDRPAETDPEPESRFGRLKQSALNRWRVRDRDTQG